MEDIFRDQVTQIQEINREAATTLYVKQLQQQREELKKDNQKYVTEKVKEMLGYYRSSQVNLQLDSKPVSVYRQINKATINA
eukprot:8978770-Ditylum_brightwellii.AAC.1